MKIHWLDLNRLEGSQPVTVIVDSSWDWSMRSHPRFAGCGFEQINAISQLVLDAADPFWTLPQWDFSETRSTVSIASQPTEFGTQLPESLFWCGWDQFGEFDCTEGWDSEYWRMGGWPSSLVAEPSLITLIPTPADTIDLRWFVTQHQRRLAPLPIGVGVAEVYRSMGLDYPTELELDTDDLAQWHDCAWTWASRCSWREYFGLWKKNYLTVLDTLLDRNQLQWFANPPTWARNTQRLIATLQRGQARFRHYRAWLAAVV